MNIYKFSKEFLSELYVPFLETYVNVCGVNDYYERVLGMICRIENCNLYAFHANGRKWFEIDTKEDLKQAEKMFEF